MSRLQLLIFFSFHFSSFANVQGTTKSPEWRGVVPANHSHPTSWRAMVLPPPPPPCDSNALVRATVGVVSALFGTVEIGGWFFLVVREDPLFSVI